MLPFPFEVGKEYAVFIAIWLPKCLHWPFCPGLFIAVLAFVAAAVTFRKEPSQREKAVWIFVFLTLMCAEVWMMSMDRETNEAQQKVARDGQLRGFKEIGDGINTTIANSDRQFQATMDGIKATLKTSEATVRNTVPRAILELQKVNYNVPTIGAERKLNINFIRFTNGGNAEATHFLREAKLYVGRPNSLEDQEKMGKDFDAWWEKTPHREGLPVEPRVPGMFLFQIDAMSEPEISGIQNHTLTVYLLARFVYSDSTGTWASDSCIWFDDAARDLELSYPCKTHRNPRYAFKRHLEP